MEAEGGATLQPVTEQGEDADEYTRKSPLYELEQPVTIEETGKAFSLEYRGDASPVYLHLFGKDDTLLTQVLLPHWKIERETKVDYRIPLQQQDMVTKFQLATPTHEGDISIDSAGIETFYDGIQFSERSIVLGSTVENFDRYRQADGLDTVMVSLTPLENDVYVEFTYTYEYNGSTDALELLCSRKAENVRFGFFPFDGERQLHLHELCCEFTPTEVTLKNVPEHFSVKALTRLDEAPQQAGETPLLFPYSLPVEAGTVLEFSKERWRSSDYELFRWARAENILIMDTVDYDVQSRFFKRLAFFVEKKGFAGNLLSNEQLQGRHGWNAHDYRAVDLAYFFQKAQDSRFPLNREEQTLKNILITNGIIREEGEYIVPGEGGIISISQSSTDRLREKFLLHECFHGIFFTYPRYRNQCFGIWEELDKTVKTFWTHFFSWYRYNPEDRYLMVNEFQSYLMQQPAGEVDSYFREHPATRYAMEQLRGEDSAWKVFSQLLEDPQFFTAMASTVREAAVETAGITPSNLLGLTTLHD